MIRLPRTDHTGSHSVARRLEAVLRSSPAAIVTFDRNLRVRGWNPAAEAIFGWREDDVLGGSFPGLSSEQEARLLDRGAAVLLGGESASFDVECSTRDGESLTVSVSAAPIEEDTGHLSGIVATFVVPAGSEELVREEHTDGGSDAERFLTERAGRKRAEESLRRADVLADVRSMLDATMNLERRAELLVELCVPRLADFATVELMDPDGVLRLAALRHRDGRRAATLRALREHYALSHDGFAGLAKVARSGDAELIPEISAEMVAAHVTDPAARRLMEDLAPSSYVGVPLLGGERALGAVMLGTTGDRRLVQADLEQAIAIADALATEVAKSDAQERSTHIASTLQETLLPSQLPRRPRWDIGVAYRAHGLNMEVGGDFYDVIDAGDDGVMLIVGDVCGKGPEAARLTTLCRYTARGAVLREPRITPTALLETVHAAIIGELGDANSQFATIACVLVRPDRQGCAHLSLALGGHPPGLLCRREGRVSWLGREGGLLGVDAVEPLFVGVESPVADGDVFVLFTDGVTEATDARGAEFGRDRLARSVLSSMGASAQQLAEGVLDAVDGHAGGKLRDDIAVMVVRFGHPGDAREPA